MIERYRAGDLGAFVVLHAHFEPRVYAYLRRRTGSPDDAEDLTQHVFLRVFEAVTGRASDPGPFVGWLWRVTHNIAIDHHRQNRSIAHSPDALIDQIDASDAAPSVEPPGWDWVELEQAIGVAPSSHRRVLDLFYRHGLSRSQAAHALGRSPAAADRLRRRALADLRTRLSQPAD